MAQRPNILFIMCDQLRYDTIGEGSEWVSTPHLDRLLAGGVNYRQCFTTSPVCIPARASLATGLYPHNFGLWYNAPDPLPGRQGANAEIHALDPSWPTWMAAVRDAGYRTSLFGKTHLHAHQGDLRDRLDLMHAYGLDDIDEIGGPRASARVMSHMTERWKDEGYLEAYREDYAERFSNTPWVARPTVLPDELYADTYVGDRARDYLAAYDRDEPWCCWVSFGGPHEPWDCPASWADRYDPADMPKALARPQWMQERRGTGRSLGDHLDRDWKPTEEEIAALRANYAGNVSLIDEHVGQLLATIEARGEQDNTIIIFTADHGEMNGDYGMLYKSNFQDQAVRIPLVVSTPETRAQGGRTCDGPVELIDVGSTCVDIAGGNWQSPVHARSLLPNIADPTHHIRQEAISELKGELMICDGRWKLVMGMDGLPIQLFDRETDPDECENVINQSEHQAEQDRLERAAGRRLLSSQLLHPPPSLRLAVD